MELNSCKFVKDFESILKSDGFKSSIDFSLKKYNLKDEKFSTILENSEFFISITFNFWSKSNGKK